MECGAFSLDVSPIREGRMLITIALLKYISMAR